MKKAKDIFVNVLLGIFGLYVGFFLAWLMLITACDQEYPGQCGGDYMTKIVRTMYVPVIKLFI